MWFNRREELCSPLKSVVVNSGRSEALGNRAAARHKRAGQLKLHT